MRGGNRLIRFFVIILIHSLMIAQSPYLFAGDIFFNSSATKSTLSPGINVNTKNILNLFTNSASPLDPRFQLLGESWVQVEYPHLADFLNKRPLMTASMEGFIRSFTGDAREANTKGGLGAYYGDFVDGMSISGVKTMAFQPFFSKKRVQSIVLKNREENETVSNLRRELITINGNDFSGYAYPVALIFSQLSQRGTLSLSSFTEEIKKNKDISEKITKENIAFVYTASLSFLIKNSIEVQGNKVNRAFIRVLREHVDENIDMESEHGRWLIDEIKRKIKNLANQKKCTFNDFYHTETENHNDLKRYLAQKGFNEKKYNELYDDLINYLSGISFVRAQHIDYVDVSYAGQPGEYFLDENKEPFTVRVYGLNLEDNPQYNNKPYDVRFKYIIEDGEIRIGMECPELSKVLYASDSTPDRKRQRFNEYVVASIAMLAFIKKFPDMKPGVLHLNESPFVTLAAYFKYNKGFNDIAKIYTNHTPVAAGLPVFNQDNTGVTPQRLFQIMFETDYEVNGIKYNVVSNDLSLMENQENANVLDELWKTFYNNDSFDFSLAAHRVCDVTNAVSYEHAMVTETLFNLEEGEVVPILNGSGDFWKNDELINLEREKGVANITEDDLWNNTENIGKIQFIKEIEKRTGVKLDSNKQIVSLIRRMAAYKSQYPVLKEIVRIMCADRGQEIDTIWGKRKGLGQQVVVAGLAAVSSSTEEEWIEHFLEWMYEPDLKGRFVFIPDSDSKLLQLQAIGSNICINCPRSFDEACGTSDQRNARNGNLNIVTYDSGGGKEYLRPVKLDVENNTISGSGWLIGWETNGFGEYENMPIDITKYHLSGIVDLLVKSDILEHHNGDLHFKHGIRNEMQLQELLDSAGNISANDKQNIIIAWRRAHKLDKAGIKKAQDNFYTKAPEMILNSLTEASIVYYDHKELWKQIMHNSYTDSMPIVSADSKAKRYIKDTFGAALKEVERRNKQRENLHTMLEVPLNLSSFFNVNFSERSI